MDFIFLVYVSLLAPSSALVEAPGVNLVRAHCTPCHSHSLITQNRGSRDDWIRTIRWMQEKQNLWAIAPETENKIVDYLAQHYPPKPTSRRPPLHPSLMPPSIVQRLSAESAPRQSPPLLDKQPASRADNGCACDMNSSSEPYSFVVLLILGARLRRLKLSS